MHSRLVTSREKFCTETAISFSIDHRLSHNSSAEPEWRQDARVQAEASKKAHRQIVWQRQTSAGSAIDPEWTMSVEFRALSHTKVLG